MASQGAGEGQGAYPDLRRTVDRVDERFDERFPPPVRRAPNGRMNVPMLFAIVLSFVLICG
jgi:hypothetical protein